MRLNPIGSLHFSPSPTASVTDYRLYHSTDAQAFADPNGFYDNVPYFTVPAVEGQTDYSVDLSTVEGNPFATPGTYYFVAVAESPSGLSDATDVLNHVFEGAPLPPSNLRYVAAGGPAA